MSDATKSIPVKWRTCNCLEPAMPDNLLRKLMEMHDPRIKRLNTEPCQHWEIGLATVRAGISKEGVSE